MQVFKIEAANLIFHYFRVFLLKTLPLISLPGLETSVRDARWREEPANETGACMIGRNRVSGEARRNHFLLLQLLR